MASGHVNRETGRTHGRSDQRRKVKILLANPEHPHMVHQRSNAASDDSPLMGTWRTDFSHPEFFAFCPTTDRVSAEQRAAGVLCLDRQRIARAARLIFFVRLAPSGAVDDIH